MRKVGEGEKCRRQLIELAKVNFVDMESSIGSVTHFHSR